MNKQLIFLAALILVAACNKPESLGPAEGPDMLHAVIEETSSKTVLDANNNIRWCEQDQIIAFMRTTLGLKYQVKPQYVGKASGYFSKVTSGSSDDLGAGMELDHNVIYYPYSDAVECERSGSDYALNVALPAVQTYAVESFGNGYWPMTAISEDNDITFKNVCGGLKLQLKGSAVVKSIELKGNAGELLSGNASVTVYSDGDVPSIAMAQSGSASVTLDCGDGVQLNEETVTEFILTVPPVPFDKGFTVTVTDVQGGVAVLSTDKTNPVKRSAILSMPAMTVKTEPAFTPTEYCLTTTYTATDEYRTFALYNHEIAGESNPCIYIDYGDGTFGKNVEHTYPKVGDYTVKFYFEKPITEIGDDAFCDCSPLIGVQLPASLTEIGKFAFKGSGLRGTIMIPNNNVHIGAGAFLNTGKFESFVVPYGTRFSEGYRQFNLIKAGVFYMGADIIDDGNLLTSMQMFSSASIDRLIVGNQVKTIGNYAFFGSKTPSIKNIEFETPSILENVGEAAFAQNSEIVRIDLPSSIKFISTYCPFDLCPNLKEINIPQNSASFLSEDGVLYSYNVEGGVRSIFRYPEAKEGESFEDVMVAHIAPSAFRDNKYLKKVSVNLYHGIGDCAFMGCANLTEIYGCDYPMGAERYAYEIYIGTSAFRDCISLTEYTIGETVDVIGASAFHNCNNLQRIYCKPVVPPILKESEDFPTFGNNAPSRVIYVPYMSIEEYRLASGWCNYSDALVPYDFENDRIYDVVYYVDEYGINHGQGTKIGETVWAPVNCGYHATDYKYGKLYQWGRKYGQGYDGDVFDAEGSLAGTYSDAASPTTLNKTVSSSTANEQTNSNMFYYGISIYFAAYMGGNSYWYWDTGHSDDLWNSGTESVPVKAGYDPCPDGWRVPTLAELEALAGNFSSVMTDADGSVGCYFSGGYAYSDDSARIFLPFAGMRSGQDASAKSRGSGGRYWSSAPGEKCRANNLSLSISSDPKISKFGNRADGFSVRCVQE